MIHITPETELSVICNGKLSSAPAAWWLSRVGEKANLLDAACTKTNVLLDAHSMEPLSIVPGDAMEMIEIETNFSPRTDMHLSFFAPLGARLRLFAGGSVCVDKPSALVGQQLFGEHGMYCVTVARTKAARKTYLCNTTALSGAFLAIEGVQQLCQLKSLLKTQTPGPRQPIRS